MAVIEKILSSVKNYLLPAGCLLMEIGYDQGEAVHALAHAQGMDCDIIKDYSGHDRIAHIRM
ncbi:MAG: hypothetical protein ACRCUT_08605 [Spirochaetota bacterium]